ncbi:MAG: hypothetical protein HC840_27700 [Leptolyngbyaceae cyanobacterium RM2_2_4]|nr:hypothetical protein [Leptolyngbyaceae cyanobacterium RM2_2_4]
MGFLDGVINSAKEKIASKLPGGNRPDTNKLRGPQFSPFAARYREIESNTYSVEVDNWYKSLPYGFRFNPRNGDSPLTFYLPIGPQNINVRTPFATNVISTMYGTVEEHSEVRYHDITISGTTGLSPRYAHFFDDLNALVSNERATYENSIATNLSRAAGGFFQRTLQSVSNTIGNIASTVGAVTGVDTIQSGVDPNYTGYIAFHNFFRFLLEYKRDTAGVDSTNQRRQHPLTFLNYKDGMMYDCAIRDFSLVRNAADPLLYNYNITMRCYNLRTIDKDIPGVALQQRYEQLGLDGVDNSSVFNKMSGLASGAKNTIASAIGGLKGFGG